MIQSTSKSVQLITSVQLDSKLEKSRLIAFREIKGSTLANMEQKEG